MDILNGFIEWASDPHNSNLVRTVVALLAIPGALWGAYLFFRWLRADGLDKNIKDIKSAMESHRPEPLVVTITGGGNQVDFVLSTDSSDSGAITVASNQGKQLFRVHAKQDVFIFVRGSENQIDYPNSAKRRLKYEDSGRANLLR